MWIRQSHHQGVPIQFNRQHAEGVGNALVHQCQGVLIKIHAGQIDTMQACLLRQGTGHRRGRSSSHCHQDLPEQPPLLALFGQAALDLRFLDLSLGLQNLAHELAPGCRAIAVLYAHRRASSSFELWA